MQVPGRSRADREVGGWEKHDGLTLDTEKRAGQSRGRRDSEREEWNDGLAIGLIRGSGGWAKWESSDQTGNRVDIARCLVSYCTPSIRSRTGTIMISSVGRKGQGQQKQRGER